ncbi:DUF305 domain-containing protein [Paeniglutamicibacter kerguelensis]|uniref:Uncharacterized protein (DUF305 family) n=1 Tax=Paeniglutamicibacter kerguelensis TaxID=254788 RepID=A0ABS4XHK7_9MICC|nr:DUF305 domain-containing protein [Paeniglutamicibacter kerguelensis]MBP2387958.1 uncharacterized protein (DUF305 family) [Paeniglutamicibacter kerguelensis]
MKRLTLISATALAAALALTGCATDTGTNPATTPGVVPGSMSASPSAETAAPADHNSADAMFARMMIPHHEQAVEMSELMLAKDGIDPAITDLAEGIKAAQGPEIKTMTGWLSAWGEPAAMSGGHGMQGMMSQDDMAALQAAQGTEAARLFLTQMIAHHKGAIKMAQDEIANGSNPDAVAQAEKMARDQSAEIDKMKELLAGL